MPGYVDTGLNLIDVEDVAQGHILAAQRGKTGEKYNTTDYSKIPEKNSKIQNCSFPYVNTVNLNVN